MCRGCRDIAEDLRIAAAQPWPNNRINPDPSDPYGEHYNPDRPRLTQYPDDYQYADNPPLPHPNDPHDEFTELNNHWPRKMEPHQLYRGLRIDMDHPAHADNPDMAGMKQVLYGEHPDGLFGAPVTAPNPYPQAGTPEGDKFSHHLLNFLESTGQAGGGAQATKAHDTTDPTWLGRHWTADPNIAEDYADPLRGDDPNNTMAAGRSLHVQLGADWDGRGEDLNRSNSGGSWGDESEVNLMPGAPVNVHTIGIRHPEHWDAMRSTGDWHNTLATPQARTAAQTRHMIPIEVAKHYTRFNPYVQDPDEAAEPDGPEMHRQQLDYMKGIENTLKTQGWEGFKNYPSLDIGSSGQHGVYGDGTHRVWAADALGMTHVPTSVSFDEDDDWAGQYGFPTESHMQGLHPGFRRSQ